MDKSNQGVSIHTGFPNPAIDSTLKNISLDTLLVWHSSSAFMMLIEGNSWRAEGIFDSDIAIIDRALAPRPIDKVVWLKEDIFMISPLSKVPKQASIWGVVTSIIHQYRKLS